MQKNTSRNSIGREKRCWKEDISRAIKESEKYASQEEDRYRRTRFEWHISWPNRTNFELQGLQTKVYVREL
eukprot:1356958-Amorphochlora_amoeboformis.AAC.1